MTYMTPAQWKLWAGPESRSAPPDWFMRERTWNVAPTRLVPVVRVHPETGKREVTRMVWGLIPSWAKEPSIGSKLINARGESVAEKPAFRSAFRRRRCLMLSTGFYEWQNAGTPASRPWFIRLKDAEVFAFAGLWERWENKAASPPVVVETCAIITIGANEAMKPVHHRMPVILDPGDYEGWLDPSRQDPAAILPFVKACPAEWLILHPVSKRVNNPHNDGPELVQAEAAAVAGGD
jgi:putative SOS response-associated peptidase YedK